MIGFVIGVVYCEVELMGKIFMIVMGIKFY